MAKIITMGELMLRLSTPANQRFVQTEQFDVVYGGSEANVAVTLSQFGHDSYFVSKLPSHEIGQSGINFLRKYGVCTDCIARGGNRIGVYYLENGIGVRPSKVIYDRAHSSFSEANLEDFDFDRIFKDADWFHFSGITPALGRGIKDILEKALETAKKYEVVVSVDLNYRQTLWTPEVAQLTMRQLMPFVDVCIGGKEDAEKCLGFKPKVDGLDEMEGFKEIFQQMIDMYGFKYVATTLREGHSASHNGWSALIYDGKSFYQSRHYDLFLHDRVGAGDSFAGALIHGLITKDQMEGALEFAVAASALKHTIPGDFNLVTAVEVEELINGCNGGRVKR